MYFLGRHAPANRSSKLTLALTLWLSLGAFCVTTVGQETAPYGSMILKEPTPATPSAYGSRTSKGQSQSQLKSHEIPGFLHQEQEFKMGSEWQQPMPHALLERSPLLSQLRLPRHFPHTDPDDPERHVGLGNPLIGTSWRNRPWHIGWLFGGMFGDNLIRRRLSQDEDIFGGYRFGWDFDHYWGTELRFAFANLDLTDLQTASNDHGTSRDHFWDVHLLYYPWGDASWRPYLTLGFGLASFYFQDDNLQSINKTVLGLPFGVGVKYYWDRWLAVRFDIMNNWSLGAQDLTTMHNVSLAAGVEVRFGGNRKSYYPHHPGGFLK